MKKVINGHVYDSETAKLLGGWSKGEYARDFNYISEYLYVTKSGQYFIHAEGGPNTQYSEHLGSNEWGWGELIIPMEVSKAKEWAEEHLDGDAYIAAFGEPDEDAVHVMSMSVDEACYSKLKAMSAERGESMSAIVRSLVMGA